MPETSVDTVVTELWREYKTGGADFNLTHRLFLRAEYRGLVYNSPTFDLSSTVGTDRVTHRAEPSIGFGYRF